MASHAYRKAHFEGRDYFVCLHTADPPEASTWAAYVEDVRHTVMHARQQVVLLIATDGGGPDAAQRKHIAELDIHARAVAHVFTESVVARGIVTALRWVLRSSTFSHPPRHFAAACTALGLPPSVVLELFEQAQTELPPVKAMEELRRARPSAPFRSSLWPPPSQPQDQHGLR